MASTKIRGITIELGADTTGLSKALKEVNSEIGSTQKELKDVNKLLKLDPGNTELLAQKQKLLSNAVNETTTKLDALKKAQAEASKNLDTDEGRKAYDALTREIISCEKELETLSKQASSCNVSLESLKAKADKLSDSASKVARTMAPATAVITALGTAAVSAASDLMEANNKVEVSFGKSADSVKEFAETTLDSYGIAKGTALDMAALFGDMGTSMGISEREAANMSTALVGLAGDLASFKNIGLDTATNALKGIFTGETESLKSLGVVMTQTNLDAYALQNGFGKTTAKMTESEKVMLRYQYVLDKTSNAQGDFANTSGGTANSVRTLQEAVKELSAEFGQALLPIVTPVIQKLTDMVKAFSNLSDGTKKFITVVALLIASIAPIALTIAGISSAISGVIGLITKLPALITTVTTAIGFLQSAVTFLLANPIVLTITAIVAAVALLGVAIYELIKHWDEVKAAMTKAADAVKTAWDTMIKKIKDSYQDNLKQQEEWAEKTQKKNTEVIDGMKKAWGDFKGFWANLWSNVKATFKSIWEQIAQLVKKPLNTIIAYVNSFIDAINSMIEKVNSLKIDFPKSLGGGSWQARIPTILQIPMLAKGGTVTQGTAIVGEAGAELLSVQNGQATVQPLTNSGGGSNNSQLTSLLETYLPYLASGQNLYLDGNTLVGGTASRMNNALGKIAIRGGNR